MQLLILLLLVPLALASPDLSRLLSFGFAITKPYGLQKPLYPDQIIYRWLKKAHQRVGKLMCPCFYRTFGVLARNPYVQQVLNMLPRDLGQNLGLLLKEMRSDKMSTIFLYLFIFRYLRLVVHFLSFWLLYCPSPVPENPSIQTSDCTVLLRTVDPKNPEFEECLTLCLLNNPGAIIIVTVGDELTQLTKEVVAPYKQRFPYTRIKVVTTDTANKRLQIVHGLQFVQTRITVLLDDHVFWTSPRFLQTALAPFTDPSVGIVETNKRLRRTHKGLTLTSFWNLMGALDLERRNFETRATNAIDGCVSIVSGCSLVRSSILKKPDFTRAFTNEMFFFDTFGPVTADEDHFITTWLIKRGWKIKIQHSSNNDTLVESTLRSTSTQNYLSQCLLQTRASWRTNAASLADRTIWTRYSWSLYAVYLTSLVNFALYDAALIYTLSRSNLATTHPDLPSYLLAWILCSKLLRVSPHFLRETRDILMLPGYLLFTYLQSIIKLYALFTFWLTTGEDEQTPEQEHAHSQPRSTTSRSSAEPQIKHEPIDILPSSSSSSPPRRGGGRPRKDNSTLQTPTLRRSSLKSTPAQPVFSHVADGGPLIAAPARAVSARTAVRGTNGGASASASGKDKDKDKPTKYSNLASMAIPEPKVRKRGRPPKRR